MKAPADFIIDHETLTLAKKGGEGDLVVNRYGTFIVAVNRDTQRAVLLCLYPVISE